MNSLQFKYGSMTGEQLTGGGYKSLVDELQSQRAAAADSTFQGREEMDTILIAMRNAGRITDEFYDTLAANMNAAVRNEQNVALANALNFQTNTVNGAYSEEIGQWNAEAPTYASRAMNQIHNSAIYDENGNVSDFATAQQLIDAVPSSFSSSHADAGLKNLYQQMMPDVTEMQSAIDTYIRNEEAVPQALMDAYNSAIATGAAAGDTGAAWQSFANTLVQNGDEALISAIQDGFVGNQELRDALQRSLAAENTTADPIMLDDVKASIRNIDLDSQGTLESLRDALQGGINVSGSSQELTVDGLKITIGEGAGEGMDGE